LRSAAAMPSSCFFFFLWRERLSVFVSRSREREGKKSRLDSLSVSHSPSPARLESDWREKAREGAHALGLSPLPRRGGNGEAVEKKAIEKKTR
jgi:hypothetical protein